MSHLAKDHGPDASRRHSFRPLVGPSRGDPLTAVSAHRMPRVLPDASVDAPSG